MADFTRFSGASCACIVYLEHIGILQSYPIVTLLLLGPESPPRLVSPPPAPSPLVGLSLFQTLSVYTLLLVRACDYSG